MIKNFPDSIIPFLGEGLNPKTKKPGLWLKEEAPENVVRDFEEFQKAFSTEPTEQRPYKRIV
ncbi:MAG: hypothetical protein RR565_09730 [Erysipelothrix sp.]